MVPNPQRLHGVQAQQQVDKAMQVWGGVSARKRWWGMWCLFSMEIHATWGFPSDHWPQIHFGSAKDWIRMVEMLHVASARKKSKWPHHCGRGKVSKGNQIDSNHNCYCTVALIFVLNMQHVIEFICRIPFTLTKNKHLSLVATPSAVVKGSASIYTYMYIFPCFAWFFLWAQGHLRQISQKKHRLLIRSWTHRAMFDRSIRRGRLKVY